LQGVGDSFGDLALDTEDVGELAIKGIGPQMRIASRLDELDGDAYLRGLALEARTTVSPDDSEKAVGFYERAVQLDPAFALAWADSLVRTLRYISAV